MEREQISRNMNQNHFELFDTPIIHDKYALGVHLSIQDFGYQEHVDGI